MTHKSNLYFIFLYIILFFTLCFNANAKQSGVLSSYHISDKNNAARFVVDLTWHPEYKIMKLQNPPRIILEIKNTLWKAVEKKIPDSKLIKKISHFQNKNGNLRISIHTKTQFYNLKYFTSSPKKNLSRIVINISGKSPDSETADNFIPKPKLKKVRKTIIALDAGHGGHDPGTTGNSGSFEKNITLAYAFEIKKILEKTGNYKVILTRKNDTYIDLKKRVQLAQKAQADMFVSIHADSHKNPEMQGLSVYTLSEKASDKESADLAEKENEAGVTDNLNIHGASKEVTDVLVDLMRRETKNLSADFAENIIISAKPLTNILKIKPHRFAGFMVLKGQDIPAVLIELGYLSNPQEEKMLLSQKHKNKLAVAIVQAINKHFSKYPVN